MGTRNSCEAGGLTLRACAMDSSIFCTVTGAETAGGSVSTCMSKQLQQVQAPTSHLPKRCLGMLAAHDTQPPRHVALSPSTTSFNIKPSRSGPVAANVLQAY
jgi:hypothetical protein